jgi:hypothetical protein
MLSAGRRMACRKGGERFNSLGGFRSSPENVRNRSPRRLFVERNRRWNSFLQLPVPLNSERTHYLVVIILLGKVSKEGYLAVGRPKIRTRANKSHFGEPGHDMTLPLTIPFSS